MADTPPADGRHGIEMVVITGLSGAGRSSAAKCFEDLGYFVVDNLPPELITTLADLGRRNPDSDVKLAVVIDVRSRGFSSDLRGAIRQLSDRGDSARVVFLDADDAVLIRRFESVRRQHPLQGDGLLSDGIAAERALLEELRQDADLVVDTTSQSVHDLRRTIEAAFGSGAESGPTPLRATVVSFGFKYGLPLDADMVADVRFLPNPYWIPELRDQTGLDQEVSDYVLGQADALPFIDSYTQVLDVIGAGYVRESKRYLTVAVGCTGGKHRSVAIAAELGRRLRDRGIHVTVVNRDIGRE